MDSDKPTQNAVPTTWPGAFGAYKHSKAAVKTNLGPILVLLFISIILGGGFQAWSADSSAGTQVGMKMGDIVSFLVNGFTAGGLAFAYIAGVRGKRVEIGETFSAGAKFFLRMLGLSILIILSLLASVLLLVIPFFFVLPRLLLAEYYLVDKNLGVMEAYKASWTATKGSALKIWGIIGVGILMALLMITIIGIPFAIYLLIMYSAILAVMYEFVNKTKAPAAAAPSA